MNSSPLAEIFADKTVLLRSAHDVAETIRCGTLGKWQTAVLLHTGSCLFDYRGDAVICCNDYLSKNSYGNINDKSLCDIWNDKIYRRTRNHVRLTCLRTISTNISRQIRRP